jgi:hypothetical protein
MVKDKENLQEVWDILDTCFDRPEKYISEDLIVQFRKYRAFDNGAIREFYSLLRSAMLGARKAGLLHRLVSDQTLPGIMARMPVSDWKQWAKERPLWIGGPIEDAFWVFLDQKSKDSLNVTAAEPARWEQGADHQKGVEYTKKGEPDKQAGKKEPSAGVHVALADNAQGNPGRAQKKCKFAEMAECTGPHPPWLCKAFGDKAPEERSKIIMDNKLCPFCLLHNADEICFSKVKIQSPFVRSRAARGSTSSGCTRC